MGWSAADIPNLSGRVAVVTGANGGLGFHTARALGQKGAHVVMAVRSPARGEEARREILRRAPDASLEVVELDLASLASVRAAAATIGASHPRVDMLVNNGGVMAIPYRESADGYELQFAVNHLAHFALTGLLMPAILRSDDGRVVSVSSTGRFMGRTVDPDDLALRPYDAWRAYGRSKLAAAQLTIELQARFDAAGARARALAADPGFARTDLQARSVREEPGFGQRFFDAFVRQVGSTPARGALPQLRAATDPDAEGGALYALRFVLRGGPVRRPYLTPHLGPDDRRTLWEVSERLTGVRIVI